MGAHAMHPGSAPGDCVNPGDMHAMDHRSGMKGMMENIDVVKKKELKNERIDFGEELKYDPSSGNDRICGKPFLSCGDISLDMNEMP
eukprot:2931869-Ditylum_brightwellii.AAC.1